MKAVLVRLLATTAMAAAASVQGHREERATIVHPGLAYSADRIKTFRANALSGKMSFHFPSHGGFVLEGECSLWLPCIEKLPLGYYMSLSGFDSCITRAC
jgi:hypothetical protein